MQKFMQRQRVFVSSLLGLLNGRQTEFIDYFSQLVVRESDNSYESDDDELDAQCKKNMDFIDKMITSRDEVDQRLFKVFQIRQEQRGKYETARDAAKD